MGRNDPFFTCFTSKRTMMSSIFTRCYIYFLIFMLMFTFYLAIALLLALLIVPTLIVKSGNTGQELKESNNVQDSIVDTK